MEHESRIQCYYDYGDMFQKLKGKNTTHVHCWLTHVQQVCINYHDTTKVQLLFCVKICVLLCNKK